LLMPSVSVPSLSVWRQEKEPETVWLWFFPRAQGIRID